MHYTKLQEPPRVRPRVHELAKQVGLTSAELIELLTAMGEYVRTAQELVELPVVRRFMGFAESSMNFLWRLMRLRSPSNWRRPQGSLLRARNPKGTTIR